MINKILTSDYDLISEWKLSNIVNKDNGTPLKPFSAYIAKRIYVSRLHHYLNLRNIKPTKTIIGNKVWFTYPTELDCVIVGHRKYGTKIKGKARKSAYGLFNLNEVEK